MKFLNIKTIKNINADVFRHTKPYPWINPQGFLTDEGYCALIKNPVPIDMFEKDYGGVRKGSEKSHNRYRLSYSKKLKGLPEVWKAFIKELEGFEYRGFIGRMIGMKSFDLRMEWHATLPNCPVYPHLDGKSVYGAHLFYLNEAWDNRWDGETYILEKKQKTRDKGPYEFSDFIGVPAQCNGNYSVFFQNGDNAWHGVKSLGQPEGVYRRVFTVFVSHSPSIFQRIKNIILNKINV